MDTYIPRVITEVAGIGQVGKTTVYVRRRNPKTDRAAEPDHDARGLTDEFIAISTRCMHLGCPVRYIDAAKRFVCPCHGGVYDFAGQVDGGPPVRPLDRFYTRVATARSRSGRATRSTASSAASRPTAIPAQDLDGIGQYLYPGRFSTPKLSN